MNYEEWLEQECWTEGDVIKNLEKMRIGMMGIADRSEAYQKEHTAREFIWGQILLINKVINMMERCKQERMNQRL